MHQAGVIEGNSTESLNDVIPLDPFKCEEKINPLLNDCIGSKGIHFFANPVLHYSFPLPL